MSTPRIIVEKKSNLKWMCTIDPAIDARNIPGAAIANGTLVGPPDAIAVYCKRAGVEIHSSMMKGKPSNLHKELPKELYGFQKYGVEWMLGKCRTLGAAINADDMGLGKSRQALVTMHALVGSRTLIVCPGSVRLSWKAEIERVFPDSKILVVGKSEHGTEANGDYDYVISSYELTESLNPNYIPDKLIIDEAHNITGRATKRSTRMQNLAALANYRIALSGTPMQDDRPRNLWKLLRILFGAAFGSSWDFDHAYCGAVMGEHGGLDNRGSSREDELRLRLQHYMLRRTKAEVAGELPKLSRQICWLPPDKKATGLFHTSKLSPHSGSFQRALEECLQHKIQWAVDEALAAGRFLLFTWKKDHAKALTQKITDAGGKAFLITGELSDKARKATVELAVKEKAGIVATIESVGEGFDGLQHVASVGIMHAIPWRPRILSQAEKRLDRIGQTLPVLWKYGALQESADSAVVHTVVSKLDNRRNVMGGNDGSEGLRSGLNNEGGDSEEAVLKAIYESMED